MSNKNNDDDRLDSQIYLDYDVNNLSSIRVSHTKKLEDIKEYFLKHGFEREEERCGTFVVFRKTKKKGENSVN